jgi:translation initiation factor IF-3
MNLPKAGCREGIARSDCPELHNEVKDISDRQRVNEEIRAKDVRLIGEAGEQLGIFPLREALDIARQHNVDLVEVAPQAEPPVCRLLDYGKYIYEKARKAREARKAQKPVEIKEIRLRPKTGEHDVNFKVNRMRGFLGEGFKVKVRVLFRGREITYPEIAQQMLSGIATDLNDVAVVENYPRLEGRSMFMVLAPAVKKKK